MIVSFWWWGCRCENILRWTDLFFLTTTYQICHIWNWQKTCDNALQKYTHFVLFSS